MLASLARALKMYVDVHVWTSITTLTTDIIDST